VKKKQLLLKTISTIVVLVLLKVLLQGCTRDWDLNPATTIVRAIIKVDKK
tara:strand:+ start:1912 stop:2061 length:150 start_codon:yes stop_codon:yes gene_type:complete